MKFNRLFQPNNSDFQQKLIAVDESKAIEIKINSIDCVFEFKVYGLSCSFCLAFVCLIAYVCLFFTGCFVHPPREV